MQVHPQEGLLQEARRLQGSPEFGEYRRRRQTVEHRIARLVQVGIRQARYLGRVKTLFHLAMAAAVANLVRLSRMGEAPVLDQETAMVAPLAVLLALVAGIVGLWGPHLRLTTPRGQTISGRTWAVVSAA